MKSYHMIWINNEIAKINWKGSSKPLKALNVSRKQMTIWLMISEIKKWSPQQSISQDWQSGNENKQFIKNSSISECTWYSSFRSQFYRPDSRLHTHFFCPNDIKLHTHTWMAISFAPNLQWHCNLQCVHGMGSNATYHFACLIDVWFFFQVPKTIALTLRDEKSFVWNWCVSIWSKRWTSAFCTLGRSKSMWNTIISSFNFLSIRLKQISL